MTDQILTVRIVSDAASANQTEATLQQHDKTVQQLLRSYRTVELEARKLREVGTVVAVAGAAILAPLIASADQYAKRYGQLESQSREFIAAQQRQADATTSLGRVAAQALTPIMNEAAAFTEKVAAFAAAHPELVSAAVAVGGGLAAGGAALVAAGVAISTVARAAELLKTVLSATGTSGLAGAVGTATVSVAALAVGAKAGEVAVNALGKATDDERLAHFQLSDALKTARQLLGTIVLGLADDFTKAKNTFGQIIDIIQGVFGLFKSKVEDWLDRIATDWRELMDKLGGAITDFYNNSIANTAVGQALGIKALPSQDVNAQTQAEEAGYNSRSQQRDDALNQLGQQLVANQKARDDAQTQDQQNLAKLAGFVANFADTGSLGPVVEGIAKSVGDAVKGALGGTTASGATTGGTTLPPEAVNAYLDYQKSKAQTDQQFAQDEANLKAQNGADEAKARQDRDDKLKQADADEQQQEVDLTKKYQDQRQQDLVQFNLNEKQIEEKAALDKLQRDKDHIQRSLDLAGERDVAGFVAEQQSYKTQEDNQQQQDDLEKQQRQESFNEQQAERAQEYQTELNDLRAKNAQKKKQINDDYAAEERDRAAASKSQLDQLAQKHRQEDNMLEQHFAEQLSGLSQNVAGLNSIQNAYYTQATKDAQAFVTANLSILQQLYNTSLGLSSSGGSSSNDTVQPGQKTIPSYASGMDYIPRDMIAQLHRGERVVRAADNHPPGGSQKQIVIQPGGALVHVAGVGDLVSRSDLNEQTTELVKAVRIAIQGTP